VSDATFDTGALIALERRSQRIRNVVTRALALGVRITVPAAVVTEWWGGRTDARELILGSLVVEPLSERYNQKSLEEIEQYEIPGERNEARFAEFRRRFRFLQQVSKFFDQEKVLAVIDHSRGALGGGTVFVQQGGSYKEGQTVGTPQITIAQEHWDRIARLLAEKKDVELEVNVKNNFYDDAMTQWDTIAEIPGTDKKDEIVMLGAHLDSWHSGTGRY